MSTPILQRAAAWLVQKSGIATLRFMTGADMDEQPRSLVRPFEKSAWVRSAVQKVTQPIASVELYLSENDEVVDDPALDAFWAAPGLAADGSRISQADFVEMLGSWLLLAGEYFLILDETWRLPFPDLATRTPLIIARPDRMQPVISGGQLIAWRWQTISSQIVQLDPSRVIHTKLMNPYDDWRGLGPLQAAQIAAGADYASAMFAKNISEANGDQGMIVVAKGGTPTDEQRAQITEQLRMKSAMNRKGIFRPVFLGGDISVEDPKVRSMDAAFVAQRLENRKEIAAAFGVPPSFFDPQASYSIGSASDRYILIEETCIPLSRKINGGLSRIAALQTGRNLCVESDWDDHSVMQAVRRERIDTGLKLWNTGMPMELVSDYLNLDLPEYPGWNTGYMPFSVAPVGESFQPAKDPALAEPPSAPAEPDLAQEMQRLFAARNSQPHSEGCGCDLALIDLTLRAEDSADVRLWKRQMAARRETMAAYSGKFTRLLMEARREVLAKIEHYQQTNSRAPVQRATAIDFLFDVSKWGPQFQAAMRTIGLDALHKAGEQVFAEVKRDDPFKLPSDEALRFLRDRENRLRNIPNEVHDRIKQVLQDGLSNGDPLNQIADAVRSTFNEIGDRRAKVIATTETSAAFGKGRHLGMKQAGIQFKRWLVSGNSNVRASHRAMNGTTIPIDEFFEVTNLDGKSKDFGAVDHIMHPGDSGGAPWNVINCHCVELAQAEPSPDQVEPSI